MVPSPKLHGENALRAYHDLDIKIPHQSWPITLKWGFQPPCHWTSLIFLRIQGTVYSSQDVLSFNKRIFEGRVTLELVISRVFFREPKIKDFSASKSVIFWKSGSNFVT